jgi:hypothetical protein
MKSIHASRSRTTTAPALALSARNNAQATFRQQHSAFCWQVLKTLMARFLPAATGEQPPRCIRLDELRMNSLPMGSYTTKTYSNATVLAKTDPTEKTTCVTGFSDDVREPTSMRQKPRSSAKTQTASLLSKVLINSYRQQTVGLGPRLPPLAFGDSHAQRYLQAASDPSIDPRLLSDTLPIFPISRHSWRFSCLKAQFAFVSPSTAPA